MNIGECVGHLQRILKNIHVDCYSELPFLKGLFKDHKSGRKYRPLVNGNVGPISSLSEILSLILKGYMHELQEKVGYKQTLGSTEEFLAYLTEFNEQNAENCNNNEESFIASMDVESLYPSLHV